MLSYVVLLLAGLVFPVIGYLFAADRATKASGLDVIPSAFYLVAGPLAGLLIACLLGSHWAGMAGVVCALIGSSPVFGMLLLSVLVPFLRERRRLRAPE